MKKITRTSVLAISIAIIALVWLFAVAAYTAIFELPEICWGSIVCTIIAVIITELYLLVFRKNPGEQGIEPAALGIILTISFMVVTILLNTIFVLVEHGDFNWILLLLNFMVVASYIIPLLWVELSVARLIRQLKVTEQKTTPSVNIGKKLGELLAITEDAEIRGKLLKLKEAVDYGTNISTNATAEKEAQMGALLDELAQLTIARADRLIILNKVEAAEMTWKMRSSTASSVR
ncbi:MAG: hypothetical protein IJB02_02930 [Oscillospiraceae bacterium]|nr:hypothetical protein [Oscillospiraceae bacterium]